MNTIKTLLLVTFIVLSTQISAHTKPYSDDLKSVSQQIENLLIDSKTVIYDDTIVTIKIKIDKNNKIIVVSNDSNNYEISKFIKKRLNLKEISIDKTSNYRFYSIPIKFLSTIY